MIVRGTEPPEVSHRNQLSEVNQSQFLTRIEMTTGRVDFFKVLLLFYQTVIWRRLFRGSLLEVFYKKRLRPTTLLKKRLLHRSFQVNFAKFLRTLFSQLTPPMTASYCWYMKPLAGNIYLFFSTVISSGWRNVAKVTFGPGYVQHLTIFLVGVLQNEGRLWFDMQFHGWLL